MFRSCMWDVNAKALRKAQLEKLDFDSTRKHGVGKERQAAVASNTSTASTASSTWDYQSHGSDWNIDHIRAVGGGNLQSPIDLPVRAIRTSIKKDLYEGNVRRVECVRTNYINRNSTSEKGGDGPLTTTDDALAPSHMVSYPNTSLQVAGNFGTLVLDGNKIFQVVQFHFHHPAEHLLDGMRAPLELHIVHQFKGFVEDDAAETRAPSVSGSPTASPSMSPKRGKSCEGEFTVVGIFFDGSSPIDEPNPFLETIIANCLNGEREISTRSFDLAALMKDQSDALFVRYNGSLTTPPLTESVNWVLSLEPVPATPEQIAALGARIGGAVGNWRVSQGRGCCGGLDGDESRSSLRSVWPIEVR